MLAGSAGGQGHDGRLPGGSGLKGSPSSPSVQVEGTTNRNKISKATSGLFGSWGQVVEVLSTISLAYFLAKKEVLPNMKRTSLPYVYRHSSIEGYSETDIFKVIRAPITTVIIAKYLL